MSFASNPYQETHSAPTPGFRNGNLHRNDHAILKPWDMAAIAGVVETACLIIYLVLVFDNWELPIEKVHFGSWIQPATPPPSTTSAVPVTNADSSEARYSTASAISSTVPIRPNGRFLAPAA